MSEYYFNLDTGKVEIGRQSAAHKRMGPYSSYAEAERALEMAAERNKALDEKDKEWDDAWDQEWDESTDGA